MNEKQALFKNAPIVSIFFSFFLLLTTTAAMAASVTLRWDPNDPAPEGYRVFARKSDQVYNYNQPDWQGAATTCTLNNLEGQTEYYFVVRAFDGSITSANSNEVHYIPPVSSNVSPATTPSSNTTPSSSSPPAPSLDAPALSGGGLADLGSRFSETTLVDGVEYYTDRGYQLTGVPLLYENMDAIITPNNDRNRKDVRDYLTFTMPYDGAVYVAYDGRATSLPQWMNGFVDTGDTLKTSLSSQPYLKIFVHNYAQGDVINLGGNKAPGFAGKASNYIVFYGN